MRLKYASMVTLWAELASGFDKTLAYIYRDTGPTKDLYVIHSTLDIFRDIGSIALNSNYISKNRVNMADDHRTGRGSRASHVRVQNPMRNANIHPDIIHITASIKHCSLSLSHLLIIPHRTDTSEKSLSYGSSTPSVSTGQSSVQSPSAS